MMLCRLLEDLDCTLVQGRSDIEVNAICCDSRSVTPGCVFVCLPGQHTDGRRFAHAAAAAGAAVLVFEGTLPNFEFSRSCSPALVQAEPGKARRVLALMASRLYGYPARRMTMIGITGTKGKTTTAHLLAAVLTAAGRRVGCIGTNGAVWPGQRHTLGYTTPESCDLQHILRDMADDGCDACVMEVSSLGLKMDRVGGIEFDVGVFTNLSPDHIGPGEHASYAEYRAWKSVLFRRCKVGVVNADDRETPAILEGHSCRVVRYGITAPADWLALPGFTPRRKADALATDFTVRLPGGRMADFTVPMPGAFSVQDGRAGRAGGGYAGRAARCGGTGPVRGGSLPRTLYGGAGLRPQRRGGRKRADGPAGVPSPAADHSVRVRRRAKPFAAHRHGRSLRPPGRSLHRDRGQQPGRTVGRYFC